jgi:hypothetical protein
MSQVSSLVAGIQSLEMAGAVNFLVYNQCGTGTLANFYNSTLVSDLAAAGIKVSKSHLLIFNHWSAPWKPTRHFTDSPPRQYCPACRDLLQVRRALPVWVLQVGANFAETRRRPTLPTSGLQIPNRQASFPTTNISPTLVSRSRRTTSLVS